MIFFIGLLGNDADKSNKIQKKKLAYSISLSADTPKSKLVLQRTTEANLVGREPTSGWFP